MKTFRKERISSLILEELNKLIVRELEFGGALVTLTEIRMSDDLETARVKFSVLPTEKTEKVLKVFKKFASHLRYLLLKKINIKPMPYFKFDIDYGVENAAQVEKLLINDNKGNN